MEFHISRTARDYYQFDQSLFSLSGNALFANFHASRTFAQKINQKRDLVAFPEQAVRAGNINAMGLIDEILHFITGMYKRQENSLVWEQALNWLYEKSGEEAVDLTLKAFALEFPPLAVYRREISLDEFLAGSTDDVPNRQILLEEMLLLWLANTNLAFSPFLELFADDRLQKETAYHQIISSLHDFFETQAPFGPEQQNLMDMLHSPAVAVPYSLPGQLEYIRARWGYLLGKYLFRLLSSLDLVKEEEKVRFLTPGPARAYDFGGLELELERFSPDRDWMPNLVLIAKNTYVWLDQLAKKYQRPVSHLDDIPEEELAQLARWGFSGLWLIGLWERSIASKRIKQLRGNPEAEASAYSIFNYDIAGDLGGDESFHVLRERCRRYGIRLASDMVPNHMGIDSRWVIEHPDWFIGLEYSPFPTYTFSGSNISWDSRVGIFLEDHYYDNTDAAVVFKRVDFWTGDQKYIYHGNDGTSMPWNDTAQLNYLKPEVREAVIQTILHVARMFPIIRFDAAMTLTRKHYQRLWFPEPGTGGAIPSRAEFGLTRDQFEAAFPQEFWREVVDRVAQEVPDTLLLAEAFWLMEGYFVRTLGMHRVYNSAFMNMLRDEKNQEYRLVIKNTLEFDPEIMKRYVNFMNNPDERTAVEQFGKEDKYFGICTLMVTMPGLPMFGHGQVEGFNEKYGMEYRKAYWDEQPDAWLVERHEREIFPLLHRRYLFAEAREFLLYDYYTDQGLVNEDVFAYSNRSGQERALVIYHNRYASTAGWIRTSAAVLSKDGSGENRSLVRKSLVEGLGLETDPTVYTIFRDHVSGLEYIRSNQELFQKGLYAELGAYQYHVFLDFRQVKDDETHPYAYLAEYLGGRGVPDVQAALKEIILQPIYQPYRELVNPANIRWLIDSTLQDAAQADQLKAILDELESHALHLFGELKRFMSGSGDPPRLAREVRNEAEALLRLPTLRNHPPQSSYKKYKEAVEFLLSRLPRPGHIPENPPVATIELNQWAVLWCWLFTYKLGKIQGESDYWELSRSWIDEWLLGKILANTYQDLGLEESAAWKLVSLTKLLVSHPLFINTQVPQKKRAAQVVHAWLLDGELAQFLGVNRYQGILWFNQEAFEDFLWWAFTVNAIQLSAWSGGDQKQLADRLLGCFEPVRQLQKAMRQSDFRVDRLLEAL